MNLKAQALEDDGADIVALTPAQTLEAPGSEERLQALKNAFANISDEAHGARPSLASYLLIAATGAAIGAGGLYAYEAVAPRAAIMIEPAPIQANAEHLRALPDLDAPPLRGRFFVYGNCAEARAAGAAPVHRGDPGYGPHLDRDNDGVGCEPYRGR